MIGQFKLMRMTVIWPTSPKLRAGKKEGTIAPLTIALEIDPTRQSSRSCVVYVYLLHTLLIQISKTNLKLLVKMASKHERLTIVCYILNFFICKIFMRYSKTNTTWFISRSSKKFLVPQCWMREATSFRFTLGSSLTHPTPRDQ